MPPYGSADAAQTARATLRKPVLIYGGVLTVINLLPLGLASRLWNGDWAYFVAAGETVGTADLFGRRHIEWEVAHHVPLALPWAYPPAVAWLYWPFSHIPLSLGYWINAGAMLAAAAAAGWIGARIYRLPAEYAILAVLAWGPAVRSVSGGQNASLALLLSMLYILALARERPIVAGVALGSMAFKPTDVAGFFVEALARRRWRVLGIFAVCVLGWYFASVPATAGDWLWPYHYVTDLYRWYPHQQHSESLINVSALALRLGVVPLLTNGISLTLLIAWLLVCLRVSKLESASFAGLISVATSPHANPHEAALIAPALLYTMSTARQAWAAWIFAGVYAVGALSVFSWFIGFEPLIPLTAACAVIYLGFRLVRSAPVPRDQPPKGPAEAD